VFFFFFNQRFRRFIYNSARLPSETHRRPESKSCWEKEFYPQQADGLFTFLLSKEKKKILDLIFLFILRFLLILRIRSPEGQVIS